MNFSDKIVTTIPLQFIWTEHTQVQARRTSFLTSSDINQLLKKSTVHFIIADIGDKLKWIDQKLCFDFWKNEAKQHIADDIESIKLNHFAGAYAYVASQWTTQDNTPIILLEKIH